MTSWATPAPPAWDGPAWAAPEQVERWAHRPEPRAGDGTWGLICRLAAAGKISPENLRAATQIKIVTDRERA